MFDIGTDKVCYLIVKARELDLKGAELDNSDDDEEPRSYAARVLPDSFTDDPVYQEAESFIDSLNEDEQIELVALMWIGRGDFSSDEFEQACEEARRARDEHGHSASYLLGAPLLGDYLEEALSQFGEDCEEVEIAHL